jgi:hypothetical protein
MSLQGQNRHTPSTPTCLLHQVQTLRVPTAYLIKRLLKAHRFDFGLPAGDKRVALDLIEAVIPVEQRHIGVATVRSGDAQLPAVDLANATRNVEFDPAGIMRNWPSARSSPQPPAATLFDVRKFR